MKTTFYKPVNIGEETPRAFHWQKDKPTLISRWNALSNQELNPTDTKLTNELDSQTQSSNITIRLYINQKLFRGFGIYGRIFENYQNIRLKTKYSHYKSFNYVIGFNFIRYK